MWTTENRPKYNRDKLRYPSDLTDDEWSHIGAAHSAGQSMAAQALGDPREIVNGVMYVLSTGCQWRYDPKGPAAAKARCMVISTFGIGTARWIASITRST